MLSGRCNTLSGIRKTVSDLVTPSIHESIIKGAVVMWTLYQHAVSI